MFQSHTQWHTMIPTESMIETKTGDAQ